MRLCPQPLDAVEDLFLLDQEGITQHLRPVQIRIHASKQVGKRDQGHDRRIPVLADDRIKREVTAKIRVVPAPARSLNHFQRIRCRDQHVRQHGIGVQRHRRQHLIKLGLAEAVKVAPGSSRAGQRKHGGQQYREGYGVNPSCHADLLAISALGVVDAFHALFVPRQC